MEQEQSSNTIKQRKYQMGLRSKQWQQIYGDQDITKKQKSECDEKNYPKKEKSK